MTAALPSTDGFLKLSTEGRAAAIKLLKNHKLKGELLKFAKPSMPFAKHINAKAVLKLKTVTLFA